MTTKGVSMVNHAILACLFFFLSGAIGNQESTSPRTPGPTFSHFSIPDSGFVSLDDNNVHEPCDNHSDTTWSIYGGTSYDVYLRTSGPSGSGRFWRITFALSGPADLPPRAGVCLRTTTIGWRTLGDFGRRPLPWVADEDGDGDPELIIWESFPLSPEPSGADFGLVGWVYKVSPSGECTLDMDLSRTLAHELARAYRRPRIGGQQGLTGRRSRAAELLENL